MERFDVVGAGADVAGLMCAIGAGKRGRRVGSAARRPHGWMVKLVGSEGYPTKIEGGARKLRNPLKNKEMSSNACDGPPKHGNGPASRGHLFVFKRNNLGSGTGFGHNLTSLRGAAGRHWQGLNNGR